MNCPVCKERVGNDQFAYSDFRPLTDAVGNVINNVRDLFVDCACCGPSRALIDAGSRILRIFKPEGTRAKRRIRDQVPQLNPLEAA